MILFLLHSQVVLPTKTKDCEVVQNDSKKQPRVRLRLQISATY